MVVFEYSDQVNKNLLRAFPGLKAFCRKHDIVYFDPTEKNKKRVKALMETEKFPAAESASNVVCYIRYFGPWGMYHIDDNCISICPIDIEKAPGGLLGTVKHEIIHLMHPEVNSMSHKDKEDYINSVEKH